MLDCYVYLECYRLDRRTADLVKIGETALKAEQNRLVSETGSESLNIRELADNKKRCFPYSYKVNLGLLLYSAMTLFLLVLFACLDEY